MKTEYRVCTRPSVVGHGMMMYEVCIKDNRIVSYVNQPAVPIGDSIDELYEEYYKFWRAIEDNEVIDLDRLDRKLEMMK